MGTEQTKLFYDDWYDAANTVVMALGGKKIVADMLWPSKPIEDSHRLLSHCLNRDRSEKLDPDQIAHLRRKGREVGCHALADWESRDAGYKYEPIEPENEQAKLMREFISKVGAVESLLTEIKRMEAMKK